jgi:hypothetical protein
MLFSVRFLLTHSMSCLLIHPRGSAPRAFTPRDFTRNNVTARSSGEDSAILIDITPIKQVWQCVLVIRSPYTGAR